MQFPNTRAFSFCETFDKCTLLFFKINLSISILSEGFLIENLSSGDTLLLKEQYCSFEESYFTLIKKE